MAGNARGRLKEHFQGIHKNFDWIQFHCAECIKLVDGRKSNLDDAIGNLATLIKELDDHVMTLYSTI